MNDLENKLQSLLFDYRKLGEQHTYCFGTTHVMSNVYRQQYNRCKTDEERVELLGIVEEELQRVRDVVYRRENEYR